MKKAVIAPVAQVGPSVVYSSEQFSEEEKIALALRVLPYGGNWTDFFGAECLKKVNWMNEQVVLSLTFISRQEDDFTRQGTLHSRALVMSSSQYLEIIKGDILTVRHLFQEEFSGLGSLLPSDFHPIVVPASGEGRTVVTRHGLTRRQIARIAFDVRHHHRALITRSYASSTHWLAVEEAVLDVVKSVPRAQMLQVSYTTFALSPQDPSDIVALPQQIVTGKAPAYLTAIGTHQTSRAPVAALKRLLTDAMFSSAWVFKGFKGH